MRCAMPLFHFHSFHIFADAPDTHQRTAIAKSPPLTANPRSPIALTTTRQYKYLLIESLHFDPPKVTHGERKTYNDTHPPTVKCPS